MHIKFLQNKSFRETQGFALLITLITVSVLISIGLSVLDLSIRQVRLSTNAKDSEIAFHAANAGLECALYWRRFSDTTMESGNSISPTCFQVVSSPTTVTASTIPAAQVSGGEAYQYQYQFTWGSPQRCSQVNAVVGSSSDTGGGLTITGMPGLVPGYPNGDTKVCEEGTKCTVLSVQGFNQPCSNIGGYGTVQREVLLQL